MPVYALYWDESDEHDSSYEKVRRAVYATLEEARAQAIHDLGCLRCRLIENGRTTLESTGIEPLDPKGTDPCRDCGGSRICPSKRILCVEELDVVARDHLNRGTVIWKP